MPLKEKYDARARNWIQIDEECLRWSPLTNHLVSPTLFFALDVRCSRLINSRALFGNRVISFGYRMPPWLSARMFAFQACILDNRPDLYTFGALAPTGLTRSRKLSCMRFRILEKRLFYGIVCFQYVYWRSNSCKQCQICSGAWGMLIG